MAVSRIDALRRLRVAVIDLWQDQDRAARHEAATHHPLRLDLQAGAVALTAIVVVLAIRYCGLSSRAGWLSDLLGGIGFDSAAGDLRQALTESPNRELNRGTYWAVFRIVAYTIPALLVARFVLRRPLRSFGLGWDHSWRHVRPYAVMYVLMIPFVVAASFSGEFREQYPLFEPAGGWWPRFVIWELLYLGQFVALEVFFRGFLLHGLARRLGALAIAVMLLPYVAIHLTKPLPEAIGSIVAGVVLGFWSLRTGVVWWGAALHFAVALTIDVLAY